MTFLLLFIFYFSLLFPVCSCVSSFFVLFFLFVCCLCSSSLVCCCCFFWLSVILVFANFDCSFLLVVHIVLRSMKKELSATQSLLVSLANLAAYLSEDVGGGPRPFRMSSVVNSQKLGTLPFVALLMVITHTYTDRAWLYLALHGM